MNNKKFNNAKIKTDFSPQISLGKRIVFSLFLFLIAAGILLLAEGILRLFNYGGNPHLFISGSKEYSNYYRCNPGIGKRYFYRQPIVPGPQKDFFLKEKPENGYRIFVLGGSTAAGFPYGNNLTFSRILMYRLQDTFPEKRIEVENIAMSAINSYTLLDFTDEILEYKPDLIIIYAGHNEYYGALGVGSLESIGHSRFLIKIYMKTQHLRLFRLLRKLINRVMSVFRKDDASNPEDLTATLMERIVSEQVIPLESELYKLGKEQFRSNLDEILQKADQANVPVVLSELVSNVGDQSPFRSVQSDTFPPAEQVYQEAQQLEDQGDYKKARQMYLRAKDLDALRFRATEDFNAIIHELSLKYNVPMVPMRQIFEKHSPHGIVGNELMLDHLHPNMDGYFLMADGFYQTLREEEYISTKWDSNRIQSSNAYRKDWGMTALDSVYGILRIRWLKSGWPFQPKEFKTRGLENYTPKNKVDSVTREMLVSRNIGIVRGHVYLANHYRDQKEYRKAYNEYRTLIYIAPQEVAFYESAAKMLFKLNKEQEALPILEESLRFRKNDFAIKHLARLYLQQGNVNKALSYLSKADSTLTEDKEFLNTLAHAYIASGQFAQFRKALEHIHSRKTGSLQPFPYHLPAETHDLAQQYNSASTEFLKERNLSVAFLLLNQSLSLEETAFANKWIGQILLHQKELHKALPYLQKAEAMGLKDPDLYYNLAFASYYTDRKDKAVRYLKKLKQIKPDHPDPAGLLAKIKLDE
jgi:tetratricopeptide (TPR) repeat protein